MSENLNILIIGGEYFGKNETYWPYEITSKT